VNSRIAHQLVMTPFAPIMVPFLLEGRVAIGQPGSTWEGDRLHFAANPPPDVTERVGSRPGHSSA